jgi:hypothetical protein
MGLDVEAFFDMEPREFTAASHGWAEHQRQIQRDRYESARMVALVTAQIHAKKGKTIKPTDIAEFPWDKRKTNRTKDGYISYEQGSAMLSLIAKQT